MPGRTRRGPSPAAPPGPARGGREGGGGGGGTPQRQQLTCPRHGARRDSSAAAGGQRSASHRPRVGTAAAGTAPALLCWPHRPPPPPRRLLLCPCGDARIPGEARWKKSCESCRRKRQAASTGPSRRAAPGLSVRAGLSLPQPGCRRESGAGHGMALPAAVRSRSLPQSGFVTAEAGRPEQTCSALAAEPPTGGRGPERLKTSGGSALLAGDVAPAGSPGERLRPSPPHLLGLLRGSCGADTGVNS